MKASMRVYSSPDPLMVDHIRNLLESEGITSIVQHRHLGSLAGEVPFVETWPEVWILDEARREEAE